MGLTVIPLKRNLQKSLLNLRKAATFGSSPLSGDMIVTDIVPSELPCWQAANIESTEDYGINNQTRFLKAQILAKMVDYIEFQSILRMTDILNPYSSRLVALGMDGYVPGSQSSCTCTYVRQLWLWGKILRQQIMNIKFHWIFVFEWSGISVYPHCPLSSRWCWMDLGSWIRPPRLWCPLLWCTCCSTISIAAHHTLLSGAPVHQSFLFGRFVLIPRYIRTSEDSYNI